MLERFARVGKLIAGAQGDPQSHLPNRVARGRLQRGTIVIHRIPVPAVTLQQRSQKRILFGVGPDIGQRPDQRVDGAADLAAIDFKPR